MKQAFKIIVAASLTLFFAFSVAACGGCDTQKETAPQQLHAPTNLRVNAETKILWWDAVPHANGYSVEIDGALHGTNAVGYDLSALTESKTYRIKVNALCTPGSGYLDSGWSDALDYTVAESEKTYSVTLPTGAGFTALPVLGFSLSVKEGGEFRFRITLLAGYTDSVLTVKANGAVLTGTVSAPVVFTFTIASVNQNVAVTAEGLTLNVYAVTLPVGVGYTAAAEAGSEPPISHGSTFKFRITLLEGYTHSALVVKANGTVLLPTAGIYTVAAVSATVTIIVEGVHSGTPGLHFSEIADGAALEAAMGTTNAAHVVIPNEYQGKPVTAIAQEGFGNCTNLESIVIPDGITEIGDMAFIGSGLKSIMIPASVLKIGIAALSMCQALQSITAAPENPVFRSGGECLIRIDDDVLIAGCLASVIPEGVAGIGEGAFAGLEGLESIILPDSVRFIGGAAFVLCTNLTDIIIPSAVTRIGEAAFFGCTSLAYIEIPAEVTEIGDMAFFACADILTIIMQGEDPPAVGELAFPPQTPIYVPDAAVEAYKTAWEAYAAQIFSLSDIE
ncbi:MAG: leucine-rich repeat domain-containing protein [Firmicutes bacterium]|nr:leucine-rich repeat domain-containing protein [Bacillota bacterium]